MSCVSVGPRWHPGWQKKKPLCPGGKKRKGKSEERSKSKRPRAELDDVRRAHSRTAAETSGRSHASGSGARGFDAGSWGAGYAGD
jgi:hypothetical protein